MRKNIFLFMFIFRAALPVVFAQIDYWKITHQGQFELQGNVSTLKEASYECIYTPDSATMEELIDHSNVLYILVVKFDTSGKTLEIFPDVSSEGSPDHKYINMYNEQGFLIEQKTGFSGIPYRNAYSYNSQGKVDEETNYGEKDDKLFARKKFRYDDQGNLLEEFYTSYTYDFFASRSSIYMYNKKRQLVKSFNIIMGDTTNEVVYTYNTTGKKTAEIRKGYGKIFKIRHRYDKKLQLIKETSYWGSKIDYIKTFSYDLYGNLVEQKVQKKDNEPAFTYLYTYDLNGNWTRKVSQENGRPKAVVERSIGYY
jgi:hypothetical protein